MQQFVEKRRAQERKQEAYQNTLTHMLKENHILGGHGKSEKRVEGLRRAREEEEIAREIHTENAHVAAKQLATRKAVISEMEEKVAQELERQRAHDIREDQNRKRVLESSEELRHLKGKLHSAQVSKERHQQVVENLLMKEKLKQEQADIDEHMELERRQYLEEKLAEKIYKSQQRGKVTAINQQQIILKEESKKESKIEAEKERQMVQEIVDQIAHEDELEEATRRRKQLETQEMLRKFIIEQAERQKKMEEQERAEEDAVAEYVRKKVEFEAKLEAEKAEKEAEKLRIFQSQMSKAAERNKEAEEMEYLRNELYREELEAKERRKEELAMRKKIEDRVEMLQAYEYQKRLKAEKEAVRAAEEAEFRKNLLAKFAEDDRIELLNDQKKRMKMVEHKRAVEKLIQSRRELYDKERQAEIDELAGYALEEEKRKVVIEEEKTRLLREDTLALKDYLPKGIFQKREDWEYVMSHAQE